MKEYGIRKDPRYELLSSETLAKSDIVHLRRERVRLPHGHVMKQDVIQLPEAVAVVPIFVDDSGERHVVLVEQFRNPVRGYMHEIPAGMVDSGESPIACARRELEEETGYRAGSIKHMASLLAIPASSDHRLHFYLAEGLSRGEQRLDASECLHVRTMPLDRLVQSLVGDPPGSSVIVDGKSHLGILHAAMVLSARDRKEPRA